MTARKTKALPTKSGKMEGKSASKVARAASHAAVEPPYVVVNGAGYSKTGAVNLCAQLMDKLNTAKLDKHGGRVQRSLQAVIDADDYTDGDAIAALWAQINKLLMDGAPAETKSTRRRPAAVISDADKAQIADEAEAAAVAGLVGKKVLRAKRNPRDEAAQMEKELREESVKSGAPRIGHLDQAKQKPIGHLARGLDGRNAPHSSKAVGDNRAAAKKLPGLEEAKAHLTNAPKPAAAPKTDKAAKRAERAAPKAGDDRKITVLDKAFTFGAEGTERRQSWDKCAKAKTVADYLAAGGKAKYLPRWAGSGVIKLG